MLTRRAKLAKTKENGIKRETSPIIGHRRKTTKLQRSSSVTHNDNCLENQSHNDSKALDPITPSTRTQSKLSVTNSSLTSKRGKLAFQSNKENVAPRKSNLGNKNKNVELQSLDQNSNNNDKSPPLRRRLVPSKFKSELPKCLSVGEKIHTLKENNSHNILKLERTPMNKLSLSENVSLNRRSVRLSKIGESKTNSITHKSSNEAKFPSRFKSKQHSIQPLHADETKPDVVPSKSRTKSKRSTMNSSLKNENSKGILANRRFRKEGVTKLDSVPSKTVPENNNTTKKCSTNSLKCESEENSNHNLPTEERLSKEEREESKTESVSPTIAHQNRSTMNLPLINSSKTRNERNSHLNLHKDKNEMEQSLQEKEFNTSFGENVKTPIWKKRKESISPLFNFKSRRRSTRVSNIRNKDVYEFQFEASRKNGVTKKKTKRKVQMRKKKALKSSIMKSSMLTTDPLWQPPFTRSIPTQCFYKASKTSVPREELSAIENDDPRDQFDSHYDDATVDDVGYEASISVASDTTSTCLTHINHPLMSVLPTPKINARFPGTASTPRWEDDDNISFNPFAGRETSKPVSIQSDVKLCFGFDESESDANIGLSPVKKVAQLSHLHAFSMSTFSNVEEIEPVPTRFAATCFRRPFPQISYKDHAEIPSKKRFTSTTQKHNEKKRKGSGNVSNNILLSEKEDEVKCSEEINKSVLFDVETEAENIAKTMVTPFTQNLPKEAATINSVTTSNDVIDRGIALSPKKSFTKPPRKSYSRESLEAARYKFHENVAGGYPTTDTDTEGEDSQLADRLVTRRKRKTALKPQASKTSTGKFNPVRKTYPKKKKKKDRSKENKSPLSDHSQKAVDGDKGNQKHWGKSLSEWVSDTNSHFSEVEDVALVIE